MTWHNVKAVICPSCGAHANTPCITIRGLVRDFPHQLRVEMARAAESAPIESVL